MKHLDNFNKEIKAEKRTRKREKEKSSPTGGSWAAQAKRAQVNKNYTGLPPALLPKIHMSVKKKRKK